MARLPAANTQWQTVLWRVLGGVRPSACFSKPGKVGLSSAFKPSPSVALDRFRCPLLISTKDGPAEPQYRGTGLELVGEVRSALEPVEVLVQPMGIDGQRMSTNRPRSASSV